MVLRMVARKALTRAAKMVVMRVALRAKLKVDMSDTK